MDSLVEKEGSDDAPNVCLVEYCGGWGYYRNARYVAETLEKKFPGLMRYELV